MTCPVCYYDQMEDIDEGTICPCCGTEYGYDDSMLTHEQLRDAWSADGCLWWSKAVGHQPPEGWHAGIQMRRGDK